MGDAEQGRTSMRDKLRGRLKALRERRAERAKIAADVERGRVARGEVGRYGVGDNTGYGGPGI